MIAHDGLGDVLDVPVDAATFRKIVGGWLEHVGTGRGWHAYVDEEGRLKGSPSNRIATILAWTLGWSTADILFGNVIFLGEDPKDRAEEGNVPDTVLSAWRKVLEGERKNES